MSVVDVFGGFLSVVYVLHSCVNVFEFSIHPYNAVFDVFLEVVHFGLV